MSQVGGNPVGRRPLWSVVCPCVALRLVNSLSTGSWGAAIGPTATPAFWHQHYQGLRNFRLAECVEILTREAGLFLRDDGDSRRLAIRELQQYRKRTLVAHAAELAEGIRVEDFRRWGRPGIRAQLLDLRSGKLEMDFRYEGDDRSFHVLNAVSPAFTCAIPFCAYLVDQIAQLVA